MKFLQFCLWWLNFCCSSKWHNVRNLHLFNDGEVLFDNALSNASSDFNTLDSILPKTSAKNVSTATNTTTNLQSTPNTQGNLQAKTFISENHSQRVEIQEALKRGFFSVARYSKSLNDDLLYVALATHLNNEVVILRLSMPTSSIHSIMFDNVPFLALEFFTLIGLCAFVAKVLTNNIVAPLSQEIESILKNPPYLELLPFISRIREQEREIKRKLNVQKRKQNQMLTLTQNISDGLILLKQNGKIMLFNKKARAHFSELDFISNVREILHYEFLANALRFLDKCKNSTQRRVKIKHCLNVLKDTEVLFVPIIAKGKESQKHKVMQKCKGVIVILREFSAKQKASALRREFSLNVTHELKTPLTSIVASAELLQNNLVSPKDLPHIATTIQSESAYLLKMIDEVLYISFLDTHKKLPTVRLNLKHIVLRVFERLRLLADSKNIKLECIIDETCAIDGNAKLIENLIYNLVDNAITYNRVCGNVRVEANSGLKKVALAVMDNGLGIKDSQHKRVFERFYRANKEVARGSGLGLAIVKSIAKVHNATVKLQSKENEGSCFMVSFKLPKERT